MITITNLTNGQQIRLDRIGTTTKMSVDFGMFLRHAQGELSMTNYHSLSHNYNHFSQACLTFLFGQDKMPSDVINIVDIIRNSRMGAMIIPFIE